MDLASTAIVQARVQSNSAFDLNVAVLAINPPFEANSDFLYPPPFSWTHETITQPYLSKEHLARFHSLSSFFFHLVFTTHRTSSFEHCNRTKTAKPTTMVKPRPIVVGSPARNSHATENEVGERTPEMIRTRFQRFASTAPFFPAGPRIMQGGQGGIAFGANTSSSGEHDLNAT